MESNSYTHVQYTRTDSVRIFDLRSVRTVKAVTNREHLSYGPHISFSWPGLHLNVNGTLNVNGPYVSFSSPGLHLIKDRAP